MVSFDYSVVKHYKFYGFVKKVFGPIFRAVYKLEFHGLENVPQDKNVRYIVAVNHTCCLLYTSPSPRDKRQSRMPSSA